MGAIVLFDRMSGLQPTVFIIDDDEIVLKALTCLLQSAGLHVAAFTAPQAYLEQGDPEVSGCIVPDVQMPEIDGCYCNKCRLLRAMRCRWCFSPGMRMFL